MSVETPVPVAVSDELLGRIVGVEHDGQLDYDLRFLAAADPAPLDAAAIEADAEGVVRKRATTIMQSLARQLFTLPSERAEDNGRLVTLPESSTWRLPRAKHVPKPKPLTKWQEFAQKRGIQKQKRSKEVWDEVAGEWRRRYGYKGANDKMDIPIVEAGPDDKPGEDPFTNEIKAKKERVKKNKTQQLENLKRADKKGGERALPATVKLTQSLPEHGRGGNPLKRKGMVKDIKAASMLSGVSTASMGKFDQRLADEKDGERTMQSKRRKFLSVAGGKDNEVIKKVVDRMVRERSDDIIDMATLARKDNQARRQARIEEVFEKKNKTPKKARGTGRKASRQGK